MSGVRLQDYGVSPVTGFLPESVPLPRLPDAFDAWERIAQDLPALILTRRLRTMVDEMPLLSIGKLRTIEEQRRACSILGFMAHAYVWSPPDVVDRLPEQLAIPLLEVNEILGLPPLATYAGLCLWNFRTVIPCEVPEWDLNTLASLTTYTGAYDEAWFYLISVMLEKKGGPCLANGLSAIDAALEGDVSGVIAGLNQLALDIDGLTAIMMRMSEFLDPHFFYNRLRPYLAGWKGMEKAGLANGVYYGRELTPRAYSGGSNGQSSLIQALDIILNVQHFDLGDRKPANPIGADGQPAADGAAGRSNAFLIEMRKYMPGEHRAFLLKLEEVAVIRPFVMKNASAHHGLVDSYDHCLMKLRDFRSKHIQIVMRYISLQARNNSKGMGLAKNKAGGETGTGGTALMPFLKQTRDEVSDVAAGNWGRSLVTEAPRRQSHPGVENPDNF